MDKKLTMLMILDGFGINENEKSNAVKLAKMPNWNKLLKQNPNTTISASGLDVGLPEGQMGNSEVGHTNIGAGRIVYQDFTRITKSIAEGEFFSIKELNTAIEKCKKNKTKLHVMGLVSDGGVHSHLRHLYAILELAQRKGFEDVYIHCFLDGRDTPPASAESYLMELENKISEKGIGKIASICGRFYGMDRDKRWERVKLCYDALVNGIGNKASSAINAIEDSYQKEIFDEFVKPTLICNGENPIATISKNDSVIFFNFRPDRAREITRALVDDRFSEFETKNLNLYFVCFTQYDYTMPNVHIAYKPQEIKNTFGEYISKKGLSQLRISETEKYSHVTFFFNGGEERQYLNEDRILIPSPKVETYDLIPEMNAIKITDSVIEAIQENKYDTIILNYPNPDMVGHTGNIEATIKALEVIDKCIGRVASEVNKVNGILVITSDHGNAEQMVDYVTGDPHTAHTSNDVPLVIYGKDNIKLKQGRLCDIAPTMLELMELEKPEEMTGTSLIEK